MHESFRQEICGGLTDDVGSTYTFALGGGGVGGNDAELHSTEKFSPPLPPTASRLVYRPRGSDHSVPVEVAPEP